MRKTPWQIDTSIGNWYYDNNFKNKENGTMYYSSGRIIRVLIDLVSKNGNMMMNILQHPNGSIDPPGRVILENLAKFMKYNS